MAITTTTLDCGMPLIAEPIAGARSAAISWLIPAGTATEPADRGGMSAMWAELILRGAGTLRSRDLANALDRLGLSRSTDVGSYHVRLAATTLGTRLLDALAVLADMVRRPRFDDDAIEPTRNLCVQAVESLRDDPHERAAIAARDRHLPAPFNRPHVGNLDGLRAVTRAELVDGWSRRAVPEGSIVSVAGAVDPAAVARRLNELLRDWTGTYAPPAFGGTPRRGYGHEPDQTNQVQIILMHDAPAERETSSRLEKMVAAVLSGGMSGRLFSEVREKRGLCYSVSAGYTSGKEFGAVAAYVGTTPERAQQSLDVLRAELERINTPEGRITSEELSRAVIGMKSRLVFSGESTAARAGALAHDYHRLGRARSLDELEVEIDGVTLAKLNQYLGTRRLGSLTIQTLGPSALSG
jgi:predicted Zn-dependent peptidase